MPRAYCTIRDAPHYRRAAFDAGLRACGFTVHDFLPSQPPGPGDVMVIWNRYGDKEPAADTWEKQGGTVIVAENGYIGRDAQGRQHYALAIHGHNGSGRWSVGGPERWAALGIDLKPWRLEGEHVLVCPNRSFGTRTTAMPHDWERKSVLELRKHTKRPIRVRPHPGSSAPARLLADDLVNAWCVVIWASSCGVHALAAGIPVICTAPHWICKAAADLDWLTLNQACVRDRRQEAFERMAWAQWTVDEIASGKPFRYLLSDSRQAESCAAV